MNPIFQKLIWLLGLALYGLAAPAALAQAFPSEPIRIIVPLPAGGTADVLARIVGQKMSDAWGQPVVVENRPGSSGDLGADRVAKAPEDGDTPCLLVTSNPPPASNMAELVALGQDRPGRDNHA